MRLDPEILDGTPEIGARILALARLADAEEALARLSNPQDANATRGFRGALRRLRSALVALAPGLAGAVRDEHLALLASAARGTRAARESDVLAAWLGAARAELAGPYRGALDWLADRVERRRRGAEAEVGAVAARRFGRLAPKLHSELTAARGAAPLRPGAPASFSALLATALRAQTRALREAVMRVAGHTDADGLELARIEGRRLGDLLDTLRGSEIETEAADGALRSLQGLLGDWRDAHLAHASLEGALLDARAEDVRRGAPGAGIASQALRAGLLAMLQLAQRRAAELALRIEREHLAVKASPVTDAAYAVVAALEARGADDDGAGAEAPAPERRFLVTGIPPEGRGGEVDELEQGWLPGDGRESVGITRSALGEQWFRARAPGRGRPARVEPISRGDFEAFWPLTDGRRVAKRRLVVPSAPGWRFDEYLDRPLVLAVAEEGNRDAPPPWLEPVLVRDVSPERGYLDEALARRPARRAG